MVILFLIFYYVSTLLLVVYMYNKIIRYGYEDIHLLKLCRRIINRFSIIIANNFSFIIWNENEIGQGLNRKVSNLSSVFTYTISYLIGYIVLPYVFLSVIYKETDGNVSTVVIFLGVMIYIIYEKVIKNIKELSGLIRDFIEVDRMLEYHKNLYTIKKIPSSIIIIFILSMLCYFIFIVPMIENFDTTIQDFFDKNPFICLIIIVLFLMYLFHEEYRSNSMEKSKYFEEQKRIIIDNNYLSPFTNFIAEVCNDLNIDDIEFRVENGDLFAYALTEKNKRPIINISASVFEELKYNNNMRKIINIILMHEIAHVYYKDATSIQKRVRFSAMIYFMLFISSFALLYFLLENISSYNIFCLYLLLFFLVILHFYSKIVCDKRYWITVAELKADLFGIEKGYLTVEDFNIFYDFYDFDNVDENIKKKIKNGSYLYKKHKRTFEINYHPSFEFRKHVVNNWKKWGKKSYVIYAIRILKWKILLKGWNGF